MSRTVANSLFRSSSAPSTSSSSVATSFEDSHNVLLKECSSSSAHIEAFSNLASNHRTFFPYHRTFSKRTNNIPQELNYSKWKVSLQTPISLPQKKKENLSESVYKESDIFGGKFEFGNKKEGNGSMRTLPGEQEKFPFGRDSTNKGNYRSQNKSSGDLENLNNYNNNNIDGNNISNNNSNNNSNSNNNNDIISNLNSNNNIDGNLDYLMNTKRNQESINEGNKILERYNSVESLLLSPDSEEKNFDFISHSTSTEKKRSSDTKKMSLSRNSSDFGIPDTFFPGGISTERMRISKENEKIEKNKNESMTSGRGRNEMLIARRSSLTSFNSFDLDSDDDNDNFQLKNDHKHRHKNFLNKSNLNHNNDIENASNLKKLPSNESSKTMLKNSYGEKSVSLFKQHC